MLIDNPFFLKFEEIISLDCEPYSLEEFLLKNNILTEEVFEHRIMSAVDDWQICSTNKIKLHKLSFIKPAWDYEVISDFRDTPAIQVHDFLTVLKPAIESNIFNKKEINLLLVDLSKIHNNSIVVVICIYFTQKNINLSAVDLNFRRKWKIKSNFFTFGF